MKRVFNPFPEYFNNELKNRLKIPTVFSDLTFTDKGRSDAFTVNGAVLKKKIKNHKIPAPPPPLKKQSQH